MMNSPPNKSAKEKISNNHWLKLDFSPRQYAPCHPQDNRSYQNHRLILERPGNIPVIGNDISQEKNRRQNSGNERSGKRNDYRPSEFSKILGKWKEFINNF